MSGVGRSFCEVDFFGELQANPMGTFIQITMLVLFQQHAVLLSQMLVVTYAVPEANLSLWYRNTFSFLLRPGKNRGIWWLTTSEKLHVVQKSKSVEVNTSLI